MNNDVGFDRDFGVRDYEYPTTTDLDAEIPIDDFSPSYRDSRFRKTNSFPTQYLEQDLFRVAGDAPPGLAYEYSDRLANADRDKHKAAADMASQKCPIVERGDTKYRKPRWYQEYLRAIMEESVDLKRIIVGINDDGNSYRVYGFTHQVDR
jgi:hypothetical protein